MKKSKFKYTVYLTSLILCIHFILIAVDLTAEYVKYPKLLQKISYSWVNPIFEQTWAMFSNPPHSDDYVLMRFEKCSNQRAEVSPWYNVYSPLIVKSHFLLSIDQRMSKYLDGVIGEVYTSQLNGIVATKSIKDTALRNKIIFNHIEKATGFNSLKAYSKLVFSKIQDTTNLDSVRFQLAVVHEVFPAYKDRNLDFYSVKNRKTTALKFSFMRIF